MKANKKFKTDNDVLKAVKRDNAGLSERIEYLRMENAGLKAEKKNSTELQLKERTERDKILQALMAMIAEVRNKVKDSEEKLLQFKERMTEWSVEL